MLKGRLKKFPNFPERIFLRNGGTGGVTKLGNKREWGHRRAWIVKQHFFVTQIFFILHKTT